MSVFASVSAGKVTAGVHSVDFVYAEPRRSQLATAPTMAVGR